ncbi:MAG: hypothetical protein QW374_04950 [Candidatus Bathyarchaeia archaeon]|nr:hypothetical protein [Candidatus Bathyarchaeota archaeon]
MSTPIIGRRAIVKKGTSTIGYATDVSVSIDAELIKIYAIGDDKPVILDSGNKSFKISIEKMYIDNTYAQDILDGSKITIEILPDGVGIGKPRIALNNVILTSWELTIEQDGVIMESIEGEASAITFSTQS